MADLLSLTGDVVGLGDSDVEDFHSFAPDTPHVMLQLADGRSLMVLGITRDEARKLGVGFSEPLTLSLSTTALDSFIDDVEATDVRDAARYRWLRQGDNDERALQFYPCPSVIPDGDPTMFLLRNGELDAAIDAAMKGDQP